MVDFLILRVPPHRCRFHLLSFVSMTSVKPPMFTAMVGLVTLKVIITLLSLPLAVSQVNGDGI